MKGRAKNPAASALLETRTRTREAIAIDSTLYVVAQICKTAEMTEELQRRIEKGFLSSHPAEERGKRRRGKKAWAKAEAFVLYRQKTKGKRQQITDPGVTDTQRERERVRGLVLFLFSFYSDASFQEQKKKQACSARFNLESRGVPCHRPLIRSSSGLALPTTTITSL